MDDALKKVIANLSRNSRSGRGMGDTASDPDAIQLAQAVLDLEERVARLEAESKQK